MGMTLNTHIERTIGAFAIVGTLAFGAWAGSAIAHADDQDMITWVDPSTGEAWLSQEDCPSTACRPIESVNLTDVPVDDYPVCQMEDCSDVPDQEGLWLDKDTGNWYFEQGELTWLIIDNTVTFDDSVGSDPRDDAEYFAYAN